MSHSESQSFLSAIVTGTIATVLGGVILCGWGFDTGSSATHNDIVPEHNGDIAAKIFPSFRVQPEFQKDVSPLPAEFDGAQQKHETGHTKTGHTKSGGHIITPRRELLVSCSGHENNITITECESPNAKRIVSVSGDNNDLTIPVGRNQSL